MFEINGNITQILYEKVIPGALPGLNVRRKDSEFLTEGK